MKLKVAIASIAVIAIAIVTFAFTTNSAKRTITTQYLDESLVSSVAIGSLQSDIATASNWSTSLGYIFANGTNLAAITYDQEATSDGSRDGQLSKAEAVLAVYDYYVANGNTLPADGVPITVSVSGPGTANIAIRRKS